MKKFYFFIFIIIFSSLVFVSCVDNTFNLAKQNISEIRYNVLAYSDEDIYISFMSGKRESIYKLDGNSTDSIPFAVISLEFKDIDYEYNERKVKYSVNISDKTYEGEMLNNPYDNSFAVDLKIDASLSNELKVTISFEERILECNLVNVAANWIVSPEESLKITCKEFKDYLNQHIENNNLQAEAFVKIVYNDKFSNEYFWHIQIVSKNGNEYSIIINPSSGEIVAKNIK